MTAGRDLTRQRFSRLAVELRLQSALEEIERRLKKQYNYTVHRSNPNWHALGLEGVPNQQLVLIGQWIATKELLDDIHDEVVKT